MKIEVIKFSDIFRNEGFKENFKLPTYCKKIIGISFFIDNTFNTVSTVSLDTLRRLIFPAGNISLLINNKTDKILIDSKIISNVFIKIDTFTTFGITYPKIKEHNFEKNNFIPIAKAIKKNSEHTIVIKMTDTLRKYVAQSPVDGNDYASWIANLSMYFYYE